MSKLLLVDRAFSAFRSSTELTLYRVARTWERERRRSLLPLRHKRRGCRCMNSLSDSLQRVYGSEPRMYPRSAGPQASWQNPYALQFRSGNGPKPRI